MVQCIECDLIYTPNLQRPKQKFCSKYCREKNWRRNHKQRYRNQQLEWRKRQRKPCLKCSVDLPYPSPGRKYCDKCRAIRKIEISYKFRKKRLDELSIYKSKIGCYKCGYNKCAASLDFHHKNKGEKEHRVWSPRGKEFKKCVLLCANCHREEHHKKKIQENNNGFLVDKQGVTCYS